MTDHATEPHHYDPLTDEGRRSGKKKMSTGMIVGIVISVIVHAVLFYFLWKEKFQIKLPEVDDTAIQVELAPPPPPPPLPLPPVKAPIPESVTPPVATLNPVPSVAPPAPPSVITNPDWARRPNSDDLAQYYPDRAQRVGKGGVARMQCSVTASGSLTGCKILSEDPPDYEFGAATMKVARLFKMKPKSIDGKAVEGGTVVIPLRWQPPQ